MFCISEILLVVNNDSKSCDFIDLRGSGVDALQEDLVEEGRMMEEERAEYDFLCLTSCNDFLKTQNMKTYHLTNEKNNS